MRIHRVALLLCAVVAQSRAASFDCAAARSAPETLICGNAELSALDETLAKTFADAASVVPRPMSLRQDERDWIAQQRDKATAVQTMQPVYRSRIDELQAMANDARAVPVEIDATTLRQACVAVRHEQDAACIRRSMSTGGKWTRWAGRRNWPPGFPRTVRSGRASIRSWTMTADTSLWRPHDANCCPTGGSAHVTLALRGEAIVLTGVDVSEKPLP